MENTDLQWVEYMDTKPGDTDGQLYVQWKKCNYKWPHVVQTHVVQVLTVHNIIHLNGKSGKAISYLMCVEICF